MTKLNSHDLYEEICTDIFGENFPVTWYTYWMVDGEPTLYCNGDVYTFDLEEFKKDYPQVEMIDTSFTEKKDLTVEDLVTFFNKYNHLGDEKTLLIEVIEGNVDSDLMEEFLEIEG